MNGENEVEVTEDRTLLPRFTIRGLIALVTICALVFVVVGMAYRGQHWAWGVTIGVISLMVMFLVHAACFGIVWLFAQVPGMRARGEQ